ncbi:MAG: DUF937 domain-containing protein [Leptolyngbya sp. IPPAS B-1204]|nr:DUF937 domain-containing protein [Elainella sp. C42_A2020_010]RNJ64917.1 MAG: DUF937 domain-containing protein [Leptolyngbya sp. IPPAS B-1204]
MGLFFDVLQAINNPNQQGSVSQLESITRSVQQATSNQGIDAGTTQSLISALGGFLQPALQQQQSMMGKNQLETLLGRFGASTTTASASTVSALFPPQMQQQMIQTIAQKTGISSNILRSILPLLIPAVLGLLGMGTKTTGTGGGNPLLSAFLNSGGNTDLGDVFKFANRFLSPV